MNNDHDRLGDLIAAPLRIGTYVAIAVIGLGMGLSLGAEVDPSRPRGMPLTDVLRAGGSDAITVAGLVLLAFVPIAGLVGALIGFARQSERRYLATTAAVLILLPVSLVLFAVFVT